MSLLMTDKLIAESMNDLIFCVLISLFSPPSLKSTSCIRYISGYLGRVQIPMSHQLLKVAEDTLWLLSSWI